VFKKYKITHPHYHGGKYNGKAMHVLMKKSVAILEDVKQLILGLPEEKRCDNEEVLKK
jgi:hypothetical protein